MWSSATVEKPDKNKQKSKKPQRLSREILGVFGKTLLISFCSFWILNELANRIVLNYVESELLVITEYQLIDLQYAILGISFVSAVVLFVILFLSLVGERLAYIGEIVKGIDALGRHEWSYEIPVQGNNELTELAECVNQLSKEEAAFQEKEKQLQEEKLGLIRSLSHDIRTPLTSLMSYSEFLKQKEALTSDEIKDYMDLVEQKSQQIKVLTDRLLDGGTRKLERIENGKLFMEQLVDEWTSELETNFDLQISFEECPNFSGEYDVEELRRVFDNLSSNIRKYADDKLPVKVYISKKNERLHILQENVCKQLDRPVESTRIGIASIQQIIKQYGGTVEVLIEDEIFRISLELPCNFL